MKQQLNDWIDKDWHGWPRSAWLAVAGLVLLIVELVILL